MDYEYVWKILEELMLKLTEKKITFPQELIDDLKSAKTMMNIYRTDPTSLEITTNIEFYLEKIEADLLHIAETELGKKYADQYLKRIDDARTKDLGKRATVLPTFVSGIPKGDHWIRIDPKNLIDNKEVDKLLQKLDLSSKKQKDGYILVHGKEENVKAFLKEVNEIIGIGKNRRTASYKK